MPKINDVRVRETGVGKLYAGNSPVEANTSLIVNAVPVYTGPPGPPGPQGPEGPSGPVGVSVANSYISTSNSLVLVLTNNTTIDAGILPQGPIGPQGPMGPQGVRGLTGDTGQQGPQGYTGLAGPPGPQGPAGLGVSIVSASIDGQYHLILNLSDSTAVDAGLLPSGPRGASGPPGPTGAQGIPGNAGSIGPTGPAGPIGPAGPAGPQGITGSIGPNGPSGPPGPTGLAGPQGIAGSTGPTGPAGPAGPQGNTYETVVTNNNASGTITLDMGINNFFNITLSGNITIALSNTSLTTRTYTAVIAIKQKSTGGLTVTWPNNCNTPGNTIFTQSTVGNAVDVYTVFTYDGGSTFILNLIGQAYS